MEVLGFEEGVWWWSLFWGCLVWFFVVAFVLFVGFGFFVSVGFVVGFLFGWAVVGVVVVVVVFLGRKILQLKCSPQHHFCLGSVAAHTWDGCGW